MPWFDPLPAALLPDITGLTILVLPPSLSINIPCPLLPLTLQLVILTEASKVPVRWIPWDSQVDEKQLSNVIKLPWTPTEALSKKNPAPPDALSASAFVKYKN